MNLPMIIYLFVLSGATLGATFLYLREVSLRKKFQNQEEEKILEKYREEGLETLHNSIQKSQAILGEAELEGIKVIASSKIETKKMEEAVDSQVAELIKESQETINKSQAQLIQFMQDLQKRSLEFEETSKKTTQERINKVFNSLEEKLADFLVTTEQKTTSSIELELRAARNLIDSYRTQQMKLIEENIIAMMEQTLSMVLGKKLSLKDQVEIVYEALEKAKIDKFIV